MICHCHHIPQRIHVNLIEDYAEQSVTAVSLPIYRRLAGAYESPCY